MRIHRLQIQAFGPFAGTEEINFDELADGGLFLLDGPTGAGKSSILDAICYALYGALPGQRREAWRRLTGAPLCAVIARFRQYTVSRP